MTKLYMKTEQSNSMPFYAFTDMKSMQDGWDSATVFDHNDGVQKVIPSQRSTSIKKAVWPIHYPEICNYIMDLILKWDPGLDPADYCIGEFNYLKYKEGDHFNWHIDHSPGSARWFSTTTVVDVSDNLVGGDIVMKDVENELETTVKLKQGDTIFFSSETPHMITPVKQGTREVLVTWIWKQEYLTRNL